MDYVVRPKRPGESTMKMKARGKKTNATLTETDDRNQNKPFGVEEHRYDVDADGKRMASSVCSSYLVVAVVVITSRNNGRERKQ